MDPLDGTKEFIKRNGEFTINIVLIQDQKPVFSVILIPCKDIIYFGDSEICSFKIDRFSKSDSNFKSLSDACEQFTQLPIEDNDRVFTVIGSR